MNAYDLRCSWCDARFGDKQARIHHEQEEHGTVTDEQVNRIMSGQDKMWDTHGADKPYGPGLNVTVPRAPLLHQCGEGLANAWPEGSDLGMAPGDRVVLQSDEEVRDDLDALITAVDGYEGPFIENVKAKSNEERRAIIARGGRLASERAPSFSLVTAGAICQQAADITAGDRQTTHGDKVENHRNISALWSAYLGVEIAPYQAAGMMVLLKLARTQAGAFHVDDYVDMAGYAGCMAEIRHRNGEAQ